MTLSAMRAMSMARPAHIKRLLDFSPDSFAVDFMRSARRAGGAIGHRNRRISLAWRRNGSGLVRWGLLVLLAGVEALEIGEGGLVGGVELEDALKLAAG